MIEGVEAQYRSASLEALRQIIDKATNKAATRLRLFQWLVFNIAVANDDCHLKNLSFFMSADGVQLAPHYDLLATSVWNTPVFADDKANCPDGRLAIALPGAERFGEVTAKSVFDAALALGVPHNPALRIVRDVLNKLPVALDTEAAALEERHQSAPAAARRFPGIEAKLVRVMQKMVVPDMLARMTLAWPEPHAKKG